MKIFKLAVAAALAVSSLAISVEPAAAADQRGDRWEQRDRDNNRDNMRNRRDDRRHYGWRTNRGHHYGWRNNRRVCRTVWRHGHRQRVCYRTANRRWR